jgi:TRAP-type uncharacterized transport system substrate-binding protein
MRLWLSQRFRSMRSRNDSLVGESGFDTHHDQGHNQRRGARNAMSLEALEAIVESRLRLMMRSKWLVGIFAILLIGGLVGLGIYLTERPTVLRMAVGPAGSLDARVAETLAKTFANDHAGYGLKIIGTDGPAKSGSLIDKGDTDLAIVRGDLGMSPHGLAVAIARRDVVVLMVPPAGARGNAHGAEARSAKKGKSGAKIEKVGDLAGRRVGIVSDSDATTDLLTVLLTQYGVPTEKVNLSLVPVEQLRTKIQENEIDAVFVVAPPGSQTMSKSVAAATFGKEVPTFLEVQAEAIAKRYSAYESNEVPAGTFGGTPPLPDDSLTTLSVAHYIVARKGMNENTVAAFAKLLYGDRQVLADAFPGVVKIQTPSTDKDAAVPVHPGAAAYLGDTQKSFFDRYGDSIFYGLLILPFFGSAAAAVAGYFKAGGRSRRLRLVNHLLEIVSRARRADSMGTLDHLQAETDKILKFTLHQITANQIDESIMQGFTLALDQARLAIADRRAYLLGMPPSAEGAVHEFKTVSMG